MPMLCSNFQQTCSPVLPPSPLRLSSLLKIVTLVQANLIPTKVNKFSTDNIYIFYCIWVLIIFPGYDDEYMLEDLEITLGDQIQRVNKVNFASSWDEAGALVEMEDTYALSSMNTLEEAVKNIIQFLGLQPAERSDKVPEGRTTHTLFLAGMYIF